MKNFKEWVTKHLAWLLTGVILVLTTSLLFLLSVVIHSPYVAVRHTVGPASTLTLDASKRTIITIRDFACAEPSPDAMGTIATELAATLAGQVGTDSVDTSIKLLGQSGVKDLFERTQGIQAIRDGMYRLCEARMNDGISRDFYEEQMIDLLTTLNFIVPLELCINASMKLREMQTASSTDNRGTISVETFVGKYMTECSSLAFNFGTQVSQNAAGRLQARRQAAYAIQREQSLQAAYVASSEAKSEKSTNSPDLPNTTDSE